MLLFLYLFYCQCCKCVQLVKQRLAALFYI